MGEATRPTSSTSCSTSTPPSPSQPPHPSSRVKPSSKRQRIRNTYRLIRSVFRSLPIISTLAKLPKLPAGAFGVDGRMICSSKHTITGTLYGCRRGRVCLSIQESPKSVPLLVIELAIQTNALQKELSLGMVRIALECEKRGEKDKTKLLDEPTWAMFCNGKDHGFGVKRVENEVEDLHVMEVLRAVSMGAGVLPGVYGEDGPDGEIAYVRANFERVVGSRDSETYYMLSPGGNTGPELSVFFVRV